MCNGAKADIYALRLTGTLKSLVLKVTSCQCLVLKVTGSRCVKILKVWFSKFSKEPIRNSNF